MSDSEALNNNVATNVALPVSNVITMNNRTATNSKQSAATDSTAESVSTKKAQISVLSTTTDEECTVNPVCESKSQNATTVKNLTQTHLTHDPTSAIDSTVSNQSQKPDSNKRVIRKIMVIDPKKLQQAGLDRKLAEAIGRHKLKAMAKEQRRRVQDWDTHKLPVNDASKAANKPTQTAISSFKATSHAVVPATVTTTCTATSNSTPNTTNATQQISSPIKPLDSLKKCLLVPAATEKTAASKINATPVNTTISAHPATKSPSVGGKVFVTPKITITRPGEEPHTVRIVPEHRLENVKYILQCKILKRQQLAAVQVPQSPQSPQVASISTSLHTTPTTEMPWIEPKTEMEEFMNIPKGQQTKKPSPAKTPQDIARVLDFSAEAATARNSTVSALNANELKAEKVSTVHSPVHIRNYSLNARKESPAKEEAAGTRAVDVARLVARIGNVTMRKHPVQSPDKPANIMEIPKATIHCKKLPVQSKHNNVAKRDNVTKPFLEPNMEPTVTPLLTDKNIVATNVEHPISAVYKDPVKQPTEALNVKASTGTPLDNQSNAQSQFNNFPLYSPLKQPFPVVTHSQDLPLPTISTFKTPFPTTLIKVGQMGQTQGDDTEKTSDNFLKNTYFVTPAVTIPIAQTPKSLIVLENKVLSQDEKIDLTALGFGTPKLESTPGVTMDTHAPETAQISQTKIAPITSSAVKNVLPQTGAKFNNRTIVSMDKLKLSSDKIAELVKAIQLKNANSSKHFLVVRKAENVAKASENTGVLRRNETCVTQTSPTLTQPAANTASVDFSPLNKNTASIEKANETPISATPNIPVSKLTEIYTNTATHTNKIPETPTQNDFQPTTAVVSTGLTTTAAPIIYQAPKTVVDSQFKNPLPPNPPKLTDSAQNAHNKSAVCVVDSGDDESDASLSAVDFIASLAAENPITEDMQLELSPEELNLNASFAMNFSPLRIPYRDRTESVKSEIIEQDIFDACNVPNAETLPELFEPEMAADDVQIGKIITISEENILKAVAASSKLDANNEQTNNGAQEVFKLTKSTEHLDSIEVETQVNHMENINNLDIVATDSLTESTVGPIIVKNLEIGAIDNFEENRTGEVIVKTMEDMPETIGKINKNVGDEVPVTKQIQMLPLEVEALSQSRTTVEKVLPDADKSDQSEISVEPSTANAEETSQETATIPHVINVGDKNTETVSVVEAKASVSLAAGRGNIDEVLSPHKPKELTATEPELSRTAKAGSGITNTKTEAEPKSVKPTESSTLPTDPTSHLQNEKLAEPNENVTSVAGEKTKAVPKRLPRFKKGKINLVQRKKTTAGAPVKLQETKSVSENSNEASSDKDLNEKITTVEEMPVTSKLNSPTVQVGKMNEDQKLNDKETVLEEMADSSKVDREIDEKVENMNEDQKLNDKETALEEIADTSQLDGKPALEEIAITSQLDGEAIEGLDKFNKDQQIKETAVEDIAAISTEEVEKMNEDPEQNDKETAFEEIADTSEFNREKKEEKVRINATVAQTNELNSVIKKSMSLSQNSAAEVDVNEGVGAEHALVAEHTLDAKCANGLSTTGSEFLTSEVAVSDLSVPDIYKTESERATSEVAVSDLSVPDISTTNESPLKSGELKRKTALISELLHPPKIPKRKCASSDNKSPSLCDVPIAQSSSTENLLLSVVKSATEKAKTTPAKNPFKKTKIAACADQQPIKGIHNLLTMFNKESNTSEAEKAGEVKTIAENSEVVRAADNLEENPNQAELQHSNAQKTDRVGKLELTDENKQQSNTANSEVSANSVIAAIAEVQETAKTCDILHVITEEKLLEQNADEKVPKAETPTTEDIHKPGYIKSDFLGFNHNSPSTQNIESNLQHILTITTSAEKTKTREIDHSTAERESPHVALSDSAVKIPHIALSDSAVKSSTTTAKTTTKKSNLVTRRKPTNRRSVPLKKRWGVLQESDEDINITDDISPADDEEDENDDTSFQTLDKSKDSHKNMNKIKIRKSNNDDRKVVEGEKELEGAIKDVVVTNNDTTEAVPSENKKRKRSSVDSIDIPEQASDVVTAAESTTSKDLEAPSKKARLAEKFENKTATNSTENDTSIVEPTKKPQVQVAEPEATMKDTTANEDSNEVDKVNTTTRASLDSERTATLQKPPPEFATSTPVIPTATEGSSTKRGRKRKLPAETVEETKQETVNVEESTPVVRKTRGRKPKSTLPNESEAVPCNGVAEAQKTLDITLDLNETLPNSSLNIMETANASQATTDLETPVKIPKKRGRKPKALLATPDTPVDSNEKQQGRGVKAGDLQTRGNFNGRLLLITNRAQLDTDEVLTAQPVAKTSKKTSIQCGLCLQKLPRDNWVEHLATHYGVGWIVGETTPINVTFRNEVLKVMIAFLKVNVSKYPLTCRMCQRTYRSALGTLLHIETCGATDTRTPCDYCKKEYSKFSVVSHMRTCSKRAEDEELNETATEAKEAVAENKEAVFNNVGRLKRASVQKAEKMLKALKDSQSTGILCTKDAKNHVEFVGPEKMLEKCAKDIETTGSAACPAQGCKFTAKDLNAVKEHFASCDLKETVAKGVYNCKLCSKTTKSYRAVKSVIKHILQQHKSAEVDQDFEGDVSDCGIKTDDESSGDDEDVSSGVDSNEENNANDNASDSSADVAAGRKNVRKKQTGKKKSATALSNSISADRLHPPRESDYNGTARLLWKEFTAQNYSSAPLFNDAKVKYTICARSDYEKYMPDMETSMKYNYNTDLKLCKSSKQVSFGKAAKDINWSQLQRLEIMSVKNEQFTFLGEAIKTATWVPLPKDIKEQYLLISTRRAYTRFKGPKIGNTLLWLYKVTAADTSKSCDMQLQYAISIPDAPVHCLAFLPSGGYDAHVNRLGVVAVGTAKNTIKVYALPLCVENVVELSEATTEQHTENFTTLQLEPVWLLALDLSKKDLSQHPFVDTQCTALCWSEFAEHMHIFAGYANGCVAYWDVSSDRNLNRLIIDGLPHYVPLNFFYTREKNVRAMALHYDSSGVRVIAVIVGRRLLVLYDLYHFTRPFILKEEITKNEATDLEWSPIWQSLAIAMGDSLPYNGRCVFAVNPSNIVFKNETIDRMSAGVNKTHYNPLQNMLANATDNGDVVFLNLREMHLKEILRDSLRSSQAVGIMDMKCLNGTDIPKFDAKSATADWSFNEENCNEKYGLVFGPVTRIDKSLKAQYLSEQRRVPVSLTPCTRINTIHCNFNNRGKHLVAAGYENGFLRVFCIDGKSFFY
ncbi:uncharacterized protein LOC120776844 [Bactrocera tryoni]|uniref:uncharacterized protein LOC120776844 n=1 Tax=Bactrocera tryoni TaxID=59916 RepID=UPI001A97D971|nr:uncharacterized protein LOC120776844 [Bactrocera tryoni]